MDIIQRGIGKCECQLLKDGVWGGCWCDGWLFWPQRRPQVAELAAEDFSLARAAGQSLDDEAPRSLLLLNSTVQIQLKGGKEWKIVEDGQMRKNWAEEKAFQHI